MSRLLLFSFLFLSISASAQVLQPARWEEVLSKSEVTKGDTVDLIFRVKIDPEWYLYSSDFDPELGPMVTTFTFAPSEQYALVGDIQPIGAKEKYDDIWEGNYTYFTEEAEFRQAVKILEAGINNIQGSYEYQVCSDVTGQCIPFEDEFTFEFDTKANPTSTQPSAETESTIIPPAVSSDYNQRAANTPYTLFTFFLVAFVAGLAALLTPCVFPMIPMTVTFFTSDSTGRGQAIRKALVYGASIVIIYVVAGTLVSLIFGPAFANWLSTHWLPNLFFFAIFVVFGLSFLGLFEITLPSGMVNKN